MNDEIKTNDYDSEPIFYCAKCYSLKIKYEEAIDSNYCEECGCSDILEGDIHEWEKLYEKRYHHKFVEDSTDYRETPIFKASIKELKRWMFGYARYKEIVFSMYQKCPKGLDREDLVLWFFDKLIKDNKIDNFKFLLLKRGITI